MITVSPDLEARLRARADEEGIAIDAYLEQLLRDDDAEVAHTEVLLREAAASGDYSVLDNAVWDRIEQNASAHLRDRR